MRIDDVIKLYQLIVTLRYGVCDDKDYISPYLDKVITFLKLYVKEVCFTDII